jgi:hypothetical protein
MLNKERMINMDTPEARRLCAESGGVLIDGVCLTREQADLRAAQLQCALVGGLWDGKACGPSIEAADCTDSTPDLTPGQFAVGWGAVPAGTKHVVVEYKPEGQRKRTYGKGKIKPDYKPPLIISGQKPGVKVTCTVRAVDEWSRQLGYSDTFTLTTKA